MAKKISAKSKGYRKTVEKKPYLTKKEIIITACIAAALILAFVLFNLLYDDGSLKIKNGELQVSENSLVLNTGSSKYPVYYKIGQIADIEGYSLDSHPQGTDPHDMEYVYYPEGESDIDLISVNTYAYDASVFSSSAEMTYSSDPAIEHSALQTIEDDGHSVSYLTFRVLEQEEPAAAADTSEETADETTAEEITYVQALHAYVSVNTDQCVYILIRNDVETPDQYVEDTVLEDALQQVLSALSYETK